MASFIDPDFQFRWYLCKETKYKNWECQQTTMKEALEPQPLGSTVKAIPLWRITPAFVDSLRLHWALHPSVKVQR